MSVEQRVRDLVAPLLDDPALELVDVEFAGGTLRVTIDRDGGLQVDDLSIHTPDLDDVFFALTGEGATAPKGTDS